MVKTRLCLLKLVRGTRTASLKHLCPLRGACLVHHSEVAPYVPRLRFALRAVCIEIDYSRGVPCVLLSCSGRASVRKRRRRRGRRRGACCVTGVEGARYRFVRARAARMAAVTAVVLVPHRRPADPPTPPPRRDAPCEWARVETPAGAEAGGTCPHRPRPPPPSARRSRPWRCRAQDGAAPGLPRAPRPPPPPTDAAVECGSAGATTPAAVAATTARRAGGGHAPRGGAGRGRGCGRGGSRGDSVGAQSSSTDARPPPPTAAAQRPKAGAHARGGGGRSGGGGGGGGGRRGGGCGGPAARHASGQRLWRGGAHHGYDTYRPKHVCC